MINSNNHNNDESTIGKIMSGDISNLNVTENDINNIYIILGSIFRKTNNFNSNNENNINNPL